MRRCSNGICCESDGFSAAHSPSLVQPWPAPIVAWWCALYASVLWCAWQVVCCMLRAACCMRHAACLRCAWLFVTPLEVQRRLLILHSHEVTEPASDQMQTEMHRCVACCVLSVVGCILAACCAIVSPVLDLALHCRRLQQLVRRRKLAAADLSVQHNRRRACTRRSFPRLNKLILCSAK